MKRIQKEILVTRGVEPRALSRERGGFFGKRVR